MLKYAIRVLEVTLAAGGAYAITHFLPPDSAAVALPVWTGLWSQYGVTIAKGAGQ